MFGADPPKFLQKVADLEKRIDTACLGDKNTTTSGSVSDDVYYG